MEYLAIQVCPLEALLATTTYNTEHSRHNLKTIQPVLSKFQANTLLYVVPTKTFFFPMPFYTDMCSFLTLVPKPFLQFMTLFPVLYPLLDIFPFQFRYWQCISIPFLLSFCNVFPFQFQFQLGKYFSFNFVLKVFPFLYQLLNFLYSFYVE